jgi:hypothetical protein
MIRWVEDRSLDPIDHPSIYRRRLLVLQTDLSRRALMFDPYYKWLYIPKDERPVDYFRLLGINPDEADPDAIRAAAARQIARVAPHEDGPYAKDAARLLEEIDDARFTLLKPGKREAYEAQLRKSSRRKRDREEEIEEEEETPRRNRVRKEEVEGVVLVV